VRYQAALHPEILSLDFDPIPTVNFYKNIYIT
jgi:hypothetical protein